MEVLTKQQLLERGRSLAFEDVPAPECGLNGDCPTIRVQELTARAREAWGGFAFEADPESKANRARPDFRVRLVLHTAVTATGERLFADDDLDLVAALSGALVDRLAAAAIRLNALGGDQDELVKN
ncbi:MAG: hypothetical protein A3J75_06315 [Acidobacteria bacterium RBG_16_68_9]|nr:MAG: hypothetical protein A3J75_06315 [Acidobacteria bacterium RBG_16_68_9]